MEKSSIEKGNSAIEIYRKWIVAVTGYIAEAANLLESHGNKQLEMISVLRERLARAEGMRRKDFDDLARDMLGSIEEKEREVREALKTLRTEEEGVIDLLRRTLTEGVTGLESLGKEVMSCRRKREMDLARLLLELDIERSELDAVLKRLISMGEDIRVKDYKASAETLKNKRKERNRRTERLLDEFFNVRREILAGWLRLFPAYTGAVTDGP
jgi:hypothetical protein